MIGRSKDVKEYQYINSGALICMDITGNDATLREQQVFLLTTDETYTSIQSKIVKSIIYRLSIIFEREKERERKERERQVIGATIVLMELCNIEFIKEYMYSNMLDFYMHQAIRPETGHL